MRIPVPVLHVVFPYSPGDKLPQKVDHVGLNTVVPVLLDHNPRRCPPHVNGAYTALHSRPRGYFPYLPANVVETFPCVRCYGQCFLHTGQCSVSAPCLQGLWWGRSSPAMQPGAVFRQAGGADFPGEARNTSAGPASPRCSSGKFR